MQQPTSASTNSEAPKQDTKNTNKALMNNLKDKIVSKAEYDAMKSQLGNL